jgi:hypothetical protein
MVSTIPLVDTITPRPDPLQATPHPEQAPVTVRLHLVYNMRRLLWLGRQPTLA